MKQYEAVIEVMRKRDGYATLGELYQEVLKVPGVTWNTKTPFKSINRIVQTHDEFFRIRPGLWALKEYKDRLPKEFLSEAESTNENVVIFNHSYYQGLLLEIGNLRKRETFVPAQDKNRDFLGKRLIDLASVKKIYDFSYSTLVSRASSVDVLWFNERKMPEAAYEIEHSTDMQNSLLKFVELQDFNIAFFIVADSRKEEMFSKKIAYDAFRPIRKRVKFLSYESVSDWHTKSVELNIIERSIGY